MAEMVTIKDIDGVKVTPYKFYNSCAGCMFNTISCCTQITFVPKLSGDKLTMTDNSFCGGVCKMSPIPCCNGCGYGPCAFEPKFVKETDTKFVGTGESQLAGGCCAAMFGNKGDVWEYKDGEWTYYAGPAMGNPPCVQNSLVAGVKKVGGAPPSGEVMER